MTQLINCYSLGDMQAVYVLNEDTCNPELVLLPQGMEYRDRVTEKPYPDALVQIKLQQDAYTSGYAGGTTMRMSPSVAAFRYAGQTCVTQGDQTDICTLVKDARGYAVEHHLTWQQGDQMLRSYNIFKNESDAEVTLEMLSSFSLGKISPFMEGDGYETIKLHRLRSVWSMEGRLDTQTMEDLQLEPSWAGHAVRCERFGTVGSYGVSKFFPIAAIEDSKNHLFWGAALAHNSSWQLEVYRRGDDVQLSGGIADREFGQWTKSVAAGECFKTPEAILSVCSTADMDEDKQGSPERILQRVASGSRRQLNAGPESEQHLPMMFNEYCTTWGCPSHDNIAAILKAIEGKGFEYFVIDCGWYKEGDTPWHTSMGDYVVSKDLFPDGLDKTVGAINEAGMKAGIWFEIDNVAPDAKAYYKEDMLVQRDGHTLTTDSRRFWDLRKECTQEYLTERVIGTLNKYGFEYMKVDCNDTVGFGCDGAESPGEGLRQLEAASLAFMRKCKEMVPGLILENCASGGHRLDPLLMGTSSMASFSDAHECEEIPIIAANLHMAIEPRQSQIWAVIRKTDSLKRIAYSMINTFLGRMCLSGDVEELDEAQWKTIENGMAFYKEAAPIIKEGFTLRYGSEIKAYRHPKGWQGVVRTGTDGRTMVVLHGFEGAAGTDIQVKIPAGAKILRVYSDKEEQVTLKGDQLCYRFEEDKKAVAVLLG